MASQSAERKSWTANLMMILAIVAACVLVPMGFILADSFSSWLRSVGVRTGANFADGYPLAEFSGFALQAPGAQPGLDEREIRASLALRSFSVRKVAFRPWSGMGIAPRLNLSFQFDGRLPDPQDSMHKFSSTVIHVYIAVPGKAHGPAASGKAASVDFAGPGWDYQVIIDGFHEQARVFDSAGRLAGQGLGIYVRHEEAKKDGKAGGTYLTAGLPLGLMGDPSRGEWHYYVLVGLADSRNPSMMLHTGPGGAPAVFSGALDGEWRPSEGAKPRLRSLPVRNPA